MMAAAAKSMDLDNLPFGWFDVALVVILGFGLFRGRKNGMTKEVLPMFQWVAIVLVAGFVYGTIGQFFINVASLDVTPAYILGYLTAAGAVLFGFVFIKKMLQPKLTGSNFFGNGEYYLGTAAGLVRYACLLFFALALVHAPTYTQAEIKARQAYIDRWYGADYFPGMQDTQVSIFTKSISGRCINDYADVMLINTATVKKTEQAPAPKPVIKIGK